LARSIEAAASESSLGRPGAATPATAAPPSPRRLPGRSESRSTPRATSMSPIAGTTSFAASARAAGSRPSPARATADTPATADRANNRIRLLSAAGTISTIAGDGGTQQLQRPSAVTVGSDGVYIADTGNHRVVRRKLLG